MAKNLLAIKMSEAGFGSCLRRDLTGRIMAQRNPDFLEREIPVDESVHVTIAKEHEKLDNCAKNLTIKDLIGLAEIWRREHEAERRRVFVLTGVIAKELKRIGLTQLDFIGLANCPVEMERLQEFSKKDLLQLPARLLGALSYAALETIACGLKKLPSDVTIQELLATPTDEGKGFGGDTLLKRYKQSILNTRETLLMLGFKPEESLFLRCGTRFKTVKELMSSEKLNRKMAEKVIGIAQRQGWVKYPIKE